MSDNSPIHSSTATGGRTARKVRFSASSGVVSENSVFHALRIEATHFTLLCGIRQRHAKVMNENEHDWSELIELMEGAKRGLSFAEGLSDAEVHGAEENYGFQFPPDLRDFLQTALPLGSLPSLTGVLQMIRISGRR